MSDKLYKCPECSKSENGYNWDKSTQEYCGIKKIISIEDGEFGTFYFCPSCDSQVDMDKIEIIEPVKDKCEYCEVDVDDRKSLSCGHSYIIINYNGEFEDGYGSQDKINYCPMCWEEVMIKENSKCDCCGTEKIQVGEYGMYVNGKPFGKVPAYNIQMITYIKGRNICEDCMDKYMYIDAIFTGRDVSRGGVKYFGDGSKREEH